MSVEFDYQWHNISSHCLENNPQRVAEFLEFTDIPEDFFKGKTTLDAGCGSGRYTYALQELGAEVDSIDVSEVAVEQCRTVNPAARQFNILDLSGKFYDFILCWGVLHHIADPLRGFRVLKDQLRKGGTLHVMLYNRETQARYEDLRILFKELDKESRLALCRKLSKTRGGDVHGWYDALNPIYNYSYEPKEIIRWYENAGFYDIKLVTEINININGKR